MSALRGFSYETVYPEMIAGGFTRDDQEFVFFSRLRLLIQPDHTVLDLGAGRGQNMEAGPLGKIGYKRIDKLCGRLIGADPDPAVKENPYLAEAHVIGEDGAIPLPDASCDVVICRSVLEHVADPEAFVAEVDRLLAPGGWFCALTPNKWGYGSIAARLVPNAMHAKVLRGVGQVGEDDGREERDVFPTVFRMNTRSRLRDLFPAERYDHGTYAFAGPPAYTGGFWPLAGAFMVWEWVLPPFFRRNLHVFIRKRDERLH